jgi:hypothetical protein
MQQMPQPPSRIALAASDTPCKHTRISHGSGAVYECLECGNPVPFHHVARLALAETSAEALRKREEERARALRLWEPLRTRSAKTAG